MGAQKGRSGRRAENWHGVATGASALLCRIGKGADGVYDDNDFVQI